MSAYQLGTTIKHNDKLHEANVKDSDGKITKVTIWKTDMKTGEVFPNFDQLNKGSIVEGNLWNKPGTENWTLYPQKAGGAKKSFNGAGSAKLMDKKNESIEKFQEKKSKHIDLAQDRNDLMWARYGATDLIAHHPAYKDLTGEEIVGMINALVSDILNSHQESDDGERQEEFNSAIQNDDTDAVEYPEEEINPEDIPF